MCARRHVGRGGELDCQEEIGAVLALEKAKLKPTITDKLGRSATLKQPRPCAFRGSKGPAEMKS